MIFRLDGMTLTPVIEMMEMRNEDVSVVAEDRDGERVRFLSSGNWSRFKPQVYYSAPFY